MGAQIASTELFRAEAQSQGSRVAFNGDVKGGKDLLASLSTFSTRGRNFRRPEAKPSCHSLQTSSVDCRSAGRIWSTTRRMMSIGMPAHCLAGRRSSACPCSRARASSLTLCIVLRSASPSECISRLGAALPQAGCRQRNLDMPKFVEPDACPLGC